MMRHLMQLLFLVLSVGSALALRVLLVGSDLNGTTLLPLGFASLDFQYTINTGVNFGLAGGSTQARQVLLSGLAVVVSLGILVWGTRSGQRWSAVASALVAGGGLANAYERVAYGGVFDYLNLSTTFFENPFSFNLADIYIFLGFGLYLIALRESHDPNNEAPAGLVSLRGFGKFLGGFSLNIALLVSCLYISWQVLSQSHFFYGEIYDRHNVEKHINTYAPQNRNNKDDFELTTREERLRVFGDISDAINAGGVGLDDIKYPSPRSPAGTKFLVKAERDHLQDVANLVSKLKPIGALASSMLLLFYVFCWSYRMRRHENFWRPTSMAVALFQFVLLILALGAFIAVMGAQRVFYLLHEWLFANKTQWYFYFQDSLMTTLMPEIVFADFAILLISLTAISWVAMNLVLKRLLK